MLNWKRALILEKGKIADTAGAIRQAHEGVRTCRRRKLCRLHQKSGGAKQPARVPRLRPRRRKSSRCPPSSWRRSRRTRRRSPATRNSVPSHKREYIEWIADEGRRHARASGQAVEWMSRQAAQLEIHAMINKRRCGGRGMMVCASRAQAQRYRVALAIPAAKCRSRSSGRAFRRGSDCGSWIDRTIDGRDTLGLA